MAARRLVTEVMIEGDDAMHLRAGEVQRLGDDRHGLCRHVTERGLNAMQDRQQRALAPRVAADDVVALRFDSTPAC